MHNWLRIKGSTDLPIDDIEEIKGIISDKGDLYIRIVRKHPYIDIPCDSYSEAGRIYKKLLKKLKIVNLQGYKRGL